MRKVTPYITVGALFGALCAILTSAWYASRTADHRREEIKGTAVTAEVLSQTREVMATMYRAESATRGYLLTGQTVHLTGIDDAVPEVHGLITHLAKASHGNGVAARHWPELRRLCHTKFIHMGEAIYIYRHKGPAAARAFIAAGAGRVAMQHIKVKLAAMQTEERAWQRAQQAQYAAAAEHARLNLLVLAFVSIAPVLIALFWELHELPPREAA